MATSNRQNTTETSNPQEIIRQELYGDSEQSPVYEIATNPASEHIGHIDFSQESSTQGAYEMLIGEKKEADLIALEIANLEGKATLSSGEQEQLERFKKFSELDGNIEMGALALKYLKEDQQELERLKAMLHQPELPLDQEEQIQNQLTQLERRMMRNLLVAEWGIRAYEQKYGIDHVENSLGETPLSLAWERKMEDQISEKMYGTNYTRLTPNQQANVLRNLKNITARYEKGHSIATMKIAVENALAGVQKKEPVKFTWLQRTFVKRSVLSRIESDAERQYQRDAKSARESLFFNEPGTEHLTHVFVEKHGTGPFVDSLVERARGRMSREHASTENPSEIQSHAAEVAGQFTDQATFQESVIAPAAEQIRQATAEAEALEVEAAAAVASAQSEVTRISTELAALETEHASAKKVKKLHELQEAHIAALNELHTIILIPQAKLIDEGLDTVGNFTHIKNIISATGFKNTRQEFIDAGYRGGKDGKELSKNAILDAGKLIRNKGPIATQIKEARTLMNALKDSQTEIEKQISEVETSDPTLIYKSDKTLSRHSKAATKIFLELGGKLTAIEDSRSALEKSYIEFEDAVWTDTNIEDKTNALKAALSNLETSIQDLETQPTSKGSVPAIDAITKRITAINNGLARTNVRAARETRAESFREKTSKTFLETITAKQSELSKAEVAKSKAETKYTKARTEAANARTEAQKNMAKEMAQRMLLTAGVPENSAFAQQLEEQLQSSDAQEMMMRNDVSSFWLLLISFMAGVFQQERAKAARGS